MARLLTIVTLLLTVGIGQVWAEEEVYKIALFGSTYNSRSISSYTESWSATNNGFTVNLTNANNNSNGWSYIKMGRKNYTSVGTITTASCIDKAVTKVTLTIDALTSSKINSITLYTSTSLDGTYTSVGVFNKASGEQSVTLTNPTVNLFYKIEVDCASGSSNGLITISKVDYYIDNSATATKTLSSISVSGQTTTYNVGDSFSFDGTCTATYSDASTQTVIPSVTSPDMSTAGTKEITVSYTENGVTKTTIYTITVNAAAGGGDTGDCTWEETAISSIKSTDIVVITMTNTEGNTYAMSNNNGTGSAPTAVAVTVSGNTLTGEIADNIKWNISNSSGTLTIYPNGTTSTWLYSTTSNNGIRVGTSTSNNTFKIDTEYGYLYNIAQKRYVGVYNKSDWRSYTSMHDNIKNQTLKFYKQVCPVASYTVTYKANGGTGEDIVDDSASEIADCTFTRAGYQFTGWNTAADGSGDSYAVDDEVTSDITIYAQWEIINYSITYNLDGGTNHASNPTGYTIETETITLQTPSKTGYTFGGWYKESTFTNQVTQITKGSTGDITLYAKWTATPYTITYNLDGGTNHASNPTSYTIETETITLQEPSKIGHNFDGWYKESAFTNQVTQIAKGSTGDITLYAKWTEKALINYRTDCDACIPLPGYAEITGTYHFFPGETITLTVTPPTGINTTYTYQWQKKVNSDWENLTNETGQTYTKTNATTSDVGHYRCVVSAEGYCDAFAEYDVKCLQLNVYYNDHSFAFTTPLEKVDATTASISVNLQNAKYQYYFEITDGCENFYGFNGDIHSGWYENVELNAMNSSTHCGLQTTKFGTYIFTVDHSYLTDDNKLYPVVTVTYPASLQEADKVIYLDNNVLKWTHSNNADGTNKIYYRIGREDHNSKIAMTLVLGTANLYKVTTSEYNNFAVWHIANNGCWSGDNPIYRTKTGDDWAATQATAFETLPVTLESVTVTPTTSIGNGGEDRNSNCEFFNYDITEGMKTWNAEVIEPTNGTITVEYTHHDGTEVKNFTSGTRDLAHTCLLTITATPNTGYKLGTLTVNDVPFTSGDVHTLTEDAVIKATWTEKATPTFTWSAATCTAALEADNTFPTLNNPNTLPVTYTSSNTDVATIDANGNITLVATGPTTITAIGAETDTHKSATTTYELTVVESNCRWVEVTDNTTLEDGDEVVITMGKSGKTYALPNAKRTTSDPAPEAIDVTSEIVGNEMTSVANNVRWTVERDGDYYVFYTITSEGRYNLYCNSSDNGVCVAGSGNALTNHKFNIEGDYLKSQSQLRYLSVSIGTNSWRSPTDNTTSTYSGQTLKFYKRECLDPTEVWVEGNLTDVTCSPQLPQQLAKDGSIELTFTAADGYTLPDNVTVTNATKTWNKANGTLTISNPTNNVLITIEAVKLHTVTWIVGSSSELTEKVANGTGVTQTPANNPEGDAIGDCADTFLGWSEKSAGSTPQDAAYYDDLCTAEEMKDKYTSVIGDKIFYAVFATNSGGSADEFKRVTSLDELSNGTSIVIASLKSSKFMTYSTSFGSSTWSESNGKITATENMIFTLEANGNFWNIKKGTDIVSYEGKAYSSPYCKPLLMNDNLDDWTLVANTGSYENAFTFYYEDGTYDYGIQYYSSKSNWYAYSNTSTGSNDYYALALYIPDVSYSNYVTSCCGLVPVTNVVVSDVTDDSAVLTWTAPNTTTGITELEIRNAETDDVLADDIDVNATSATISGLDNCTTYSVYVVSVGECDAKSQIVSFTTLLSDPKTVTFVYGNGEENSTATTNCESSSITLPTPSWTGYRFLGWYDASSDKIGDGGASYTPDDDITLYAHWEELARFTVTYSVGSGDTAPAAVEALDGSSITVPALESNLYCVSFVGWTDAATYTHGTSALYEAGDSYTVTSNVTLKAVYAEGTGYVLVEDVANLAANDKVIIVNNEYSKAMGANVGTYSGEVGVQIIDKKVQLVSDVEVLTLEAGTVPNSWAFNTGEGYLCATSSSDNQLGTQVTNDANGSWSIAITDGIATITAQGTYSRNTMRYNAGASRFACYKASTNTVQDVSIYKENITGYTTSPACEMYNVALCTPDNGTLSVDKNPVEPYGSAIVTFTPESGYMLQTVTLTSGTAEQGATSYLLNDPTGTAKVTFSNIQSDIEVCATFVAIPLYTVTFVDMNDNNSQTTQTQESYGAAITAPSTASDPCDDTWTFVGWAPNSSIQGSTDVPTGLIQPGGTISGEDIIDNSLKYYSVYTNQNNGTLPFDIGKSGTYYFKVITENAVEYYAYDEINSSHRYPGTGTTKIPFELTYNNVTAKYTIKNTLTGKYLSPNYDDGNEIYELDASYDWDIMQPTLYADAGTSAYAKTGEYLFHYTNVAGNFRALYYTSYFESAARDEDYYALYLEPATATYYYNRSDCSTSDVVTMTFYNPFGNEGFSWTIGYPVGYYTDVPKGTTIEYFPTMEYNGWAFIGWTDTDYNQGKILDDENSTSDIPADIKIYNNTAGLTYSLTSDVTMYPLFTKYDDNTDVDLENGGEYYMYFYQEGDYYKDDYFGLDNHYQRVYAADGGGEGEFGYTFNCSAAQLFEFIKDGDGWNIRVKNADGTYPTKSYLVNTSENDYDLVASEPSDTWSITKTSEGDYQMWYRGNEGNSEDNVYYQAKAREYSGGTSWDFKCYNQDNDASAFYYKVYLGTCENRVFSSNPSNKPAITMNGEPMVTSTSEQSIRSAKTITISATKLAANGIVTLTSDNSDVYFATDIAANFTKASKPVTPLTITADEDGKVEMTTVYVHYKPTNSSALGTQTVTITATTGTEGQEDYATATTTAHVRNLPTDFVIAAKWGDNWYAMPADMDSQSSTDGWLIEVDDAANPTKAIAAPNTTKYGLKSVYTSNSTADRYEGNGESLVFVENVTEATPVTNKTLYNGGDASSSKTNIQVYAQYANYYSDQNQAPRYEWIPTTTDLTDYTLTSGAILTGDAVGRTVSLDNHGVFGILLQDKSYNGMVRLLPVDNFYAPAELQVVEWKQNSVSVMYTGAGTKYTTKVGNNAESSVQALPAIDHAVYSLSTSNLTTATNQPLIISIKNDANATIGSIKLTIPAIVATDKSSTALGVAEENAKATSIVVLDGATLTADATKYTYDDITVYPGGNLVVGADGKLGVYTLTLRAGSSWGAAEYENKYPQFLLRGEYSNTSGQINLDYVTTTDYYYPLSVPEEVTIGDIKYPVDIYGSNVDKANRGSFRLKYYDGVRRATGATGWVVLDENNITKLSPNSGYAFWGIPKKVSVNGAEGVRQTYGIHRIPIKIAADKLHDNEINPEKVTIQAYAAARPNDQGWNYLGNPYLAGLGSMDGSDEDLLIGLLEKEMVDGKWTGGWVYNEESVNNKVRYITITNDCQTFEAKPVAEAQIPPFTTFFIQAASVDDQKILLTAPVSVLNVSSLPARHYAAQQQAAKEITTGILLTGNDQTDRTGLLIADNFTEEYDFNADLSKFENSGINLYTIGKTGNLAYMAINQALAEQPIPVGYGAPADGEYTIAFDEDRYNATDISALYLIDYDRNEKTNLLHTDYSFVTAAGTNNERFALQVAFIPQNATSVEWVDDATIQVAVDGNNLLLNNLPTDAGVQVFDALGRVIYATPNVPTEMQITLPTGYYLVRIADKQHAVVINTVIP